MFRIYGNVHFPELDGYPHRCGRIAEEQVLGILVVDKETVLIHLRLLPSVRDRFAVIALIFDHRHAFAPKKLLFPLFRVGGHMDGHLKAQARGCPSDADPKVAGRTDLDRVAAVELPERIRIYLAVILCRPEHIRILSGLLRNCEDFVDPSSGLDRSGDRKMRVILEEDPSGDARSLRVHTVLHIRDLKETRLNDSFPRRRLRERLLNPGHEPHEPHLCGFHACKPVSVDLLPGNDMSPVRIQPDSLLTVPEVIKNIHFLPPDFKFRPRDPAQDPGRYRPAVQPFVRDCFSFFTCIPRTEPRKFCVGD